MLKNIPLLPLLGNKEKASTILNNYLKEIANKKNDFNFEELDDVRCDIHKDLKENFLMSETEECKKYEFLCSTCLSELNSKYDDSLKSKLYSAIIINEKENILKIRDDKIDFHLFYLGKSLQTHTRNEILLLGDELVNFSKSFETEVIDMLVECKTTPLEIEKVKSFILSILDKNNQPILKDIGLNEDLKIRYIKLAYFLLKFKGFSTFTKSYIGLTKILKKYILNIVQTRNKVNKNITKWLKLILGDFYSKSHELENIAYDEEFCESVPLEYVGEETTDEINRLKKMINDLTIENERLRTSNEEFCESGQETSDHVNRLEKMIDELNKENERLRNVIFLYLNNIFKLNLFFS
jgi:cob(I)alamin adenosyltransferase